MLAYLKFYDEKLTDYKRWIKEYHQFLSLIEQNILQNDNSDKVMEKVFSIGASFGGMSIGTWLLGLIGITGGAGIVVSAPLFIIGWLMSNTINNKVFGKVRTFEELSQEEQELLLKKDEIGESFKQIKTKLIVKKHRKDVMFTQFIYFNKQLNNFKQVVSNHNASNLAYKYKNRYNESLGVHTQLINKFNSVCSNNKGVLWMFPLKH